MTNEKTIYSVWIGGIEINDTYLTKDKAEEIAAAYIEDGYTDVIIEQINH